MTNHLMTVEAGGWLALKGLSDSLSTPFRKDIVLAEIEVAGTNHVDDITFKTQTLAAGEELVAIREPENMFDDRAIRLQTKAGVKLGYVPRRINDMPRRLMDAGKMLVVKVTSRVVDGYYVRIKGELILREV